MTGADYLSLARALRPEMLVVLTAFAVLFADLGWWRTLPTPARTRRNAALLTLGMLGAAVAVPLGPEAVDRLEGALSLTPVGQALKVVVLLLAVVAAWLAAEETFTEHVGEFMAVLSLATTGVLFLLGTENLLLIFVALELVSLSLYVLTAFNARSARGAEAALKYFLFGGTAAGFLLFGFSLLYGLSGSVRLPAVAEVLGRHATDPLAWVAVVLV
ncbi:MAG: proton-conducting transporter membrane subunit, partial [Verrucomicrobiota bacterium]